MRLFYLVGGSISQRIIFTFLNICLSPHLNLLSSHVENGDKVGQPCFRSRSTLTINHEMSPGYSFLKSNVTFFGGSKYLALSKSETKLYLPTTINKKQARTEKPMDSFLLSSIVAF
jgi:hypothetical protein